MNQLIFITILLVHSQFNFGMSPENFPTLPLPMDQKALDHRDQYMASFYEQMTQLDKNEPEEDTETFAERKARLSKEKSDETILKEVYDPFLDPALEHTQSILSKELQNIRNNPSTKDRQEKSKHLIILLEQQQRTNNLYMNRNKHNASHITKEIEHLQREEKITTNLYKLACAQEFNKKSVHSVFTDSETLRRAGMLPGVSLRKSPTNILDKAIAEVDHEKWSLHKFAVTWNLLNTIDNIKLSAKEREEVLNSMNNQASLLEAYKNLYKKHGETLCLIKQESTQLIADREKKWGLFSHRITQQINQQNALQMHQELEQKRKEESARREEKNRIENARRLAEEQRKQEELEKKAAQQKARDEQSNRDRQRSAALKAEQEAIKHQKAQATAHKKSQQKKQKKSPSKATTQEDFEAIIAEAQVKNEISSYLAPSILDRKESYETTTDTSSTEDSSSADLMTSHNNSPEKTFNAWRNQKIKEKIDLLELQKKAALDVAKAHKKPAHNKIAIIKKYDDLIRQESQFVNSEEQQVIDQLQRLQGIMNTPLVSQAGVHAYQMLLKDWKLIQDCLSKNNFNLSWYLHTQQELYKELQTKYQLFQKTKKSLLAKKEELEETIQSIDRGHIKYAHYQDQITQVIQKLNVLDLLQEFNATVNFTLDPTEKKESVAVAASASTDDMTVLKSHEHDDIVFATEQLEAMHIETSSSQLKFHTTQEINNFNRFLLKRETKVKQQQDAIEEQVRNYTKNLSKQNLTISQRQEKREFFRNKLTFESQFGSQLEMQIFQYLEQCNFLIDIPYDEVDNNKIDELYTATIKTFHQLQRVLQENGHHFSWYTALYNEFIQTIQAKHAALENEFIQTIQAKHAALESEMKPYQNTSDVIWERIEAYKEELKSVSADSPKYKSFENSLHEHEIIYKKLHILHKFDELNEALDYPFSSLKTEESRQQLTAQEDQKRAQGILDALCRNTGDKNATMNFMIYHGGKEFIANTGLESTTITMPNNKK